MPFQSVRHLYEAGFSRDAVNQFGNLAGENTVSTELIDDEAVSTAKLPDSAVTTDKLNAEAATTSKIADNAVTNAEHTTAAGPISTKTTTYASLITDEINVGTTVGDTDVIVMFSAELDFSLVRTSASLPAMIVRVTDDTGTEVDTQLMSFWTVSDPEVNLNVIGAFEKTGTYLVPTAFGTVDGIGEVEDEHGFFTVQSGTDIEMDAGSDYLVSVTLNIDTESGAAGTVRGKVVLQDDVAGSFADSGPQWEITIAAGAATTVSFTHYVRDMVANDRIRLRAQSDSGATNQLQIIGGSIQALCLDRSRSQGNRIARSNVATSFLVPSANLVTGANTITVEAKAGVTLADTVNWNDIAMILLARKK